MYKRPAVGLGAAPIMCERQQVSLVGLLVQMLSQLELGANTATLDLLFPPSCFPSPVSRKARCLRRALRTERRGLLCVLNTASKISQLVRSCSSEDAFSADVLVISGMRVGNQRERGDTCRNKRELAAFICIVQQAPIAALQAAALYL